MLAVGARLLRENLDSLLLCGDVCQGDPNLTLIAIHPLGFDSTQTFLSPHSSYVARGFTSCNVQIVAMGFVGSGAYLGESWNRLDFVIVLVGIVDFLPLDGAGGFLTALRPLRVLRPLRTINKFPAIRILVSLIGDTLPALAAVGLLCFFIFFVFGILAVQLWNGVLRQRCFDNAAGTGDPFGDDPYICTIPSLDQDGMHSCAPDTVLYGSDASTFTHCVAQGDNPDAGLIHFDNIFGAWVAIFQCITLEAWVDIMYLVQDGYSFWVWPYFVMLIVVGAWFAIQLMLVVITAQFGATKEAQMDQILEEKDKERREKEEQEYRDNRRPHQSLIRSCLALCTKQELSEKQQQREDAIVAMEAVEQEIDDLEPKQAPAKMRRRAQLKEDLVVMRQDWESMISEDHNAEIARRTGVFNSILGQAGGQQEGDPVKPAPTAVTIELWDQHLMSFSLFEEKERHELFNRLDTNSNGEIQLPEFLEHWEAYNEVYQNRVQIYRGKLRRAVMADSFGNLIMGCIVVNVLFMAIEHDGQPDALGDVLEIINLVFCIIFTVEMALIILAIGPLEYVDDGFRIFDGTIVILSIVELTTGGGGGLSVLRTFRLVRVFRLISFLPALQRQLGVMLQTVMEVSAFLLLLFLFMYIYAILGMILFGGSYKAPAEFVASKEKNRKNFDDFFWSLVTVFQTLTQEDWNQGMIETAEQTSGFAALYFIFLIVFGNYILFNLFVAIIIDGFAAEAAEDEEPAEGEESAEGEEPQNELLDKADAAPRATPVGSGTGIADEAEASIIECQHELSIEGTEGKNDVAAAEKSNPNPSTAKIVPEGEEVDENELRERCCKGWRWDHSLWLFGPSSAPKKICQRIMVDVWFERVIMTAILLNSIFIAMERPSIQDGSTERLLLNIFGWVFAGIYLIEFIIKVTAMNFWWGEDPYIAQGWNKLDGFLVAVSVVDLTLTLAAVEGGSMLRMLKIFRMFRTLRPLRAISKLPGLRAVVETLLASIKPIGSTLIIIGTFFLIFGILGTQLFLGKLYFCDGMSSVAQEESIKTKADCLAAGLEWKNQDYNFDNLGQSLMALFVIASIDGWVDIMYSGVDAVKKDEEPIRNNNPVMVVFFAAFILIGGFFILNMFVGVILENFQAHMKAEKEAKAALKAQQIADGTYQEPKPNPEDMPEEPYWLDFPPWRQKLVHHVRSTGFDAFIAIVILANVGSMATEHYQMSSGFELFLEILNYIFTVIFLYEAGAKLIAMGCGRYFCGPDASWNRFDFFICFISIIGIVGDHVGDILPLNPTLLRVLRILRVARILKLLKGADDLRRLLETVRRSLAQAGNLGMLLFLLYFIFAALGIELFGRLTWENGCSAEYPCEGFSIHANFENFPVAILTLFRLSTGDNWNGMMKDALREPPMCSDDDKCTSNCCSNPLLSPIFFIFFILVAQFVMLNLVVAVLMKELDNAREEQKREQEAEAAAAEAEAQGLEMPKRIPGARRETEPGALERTLSEGKKYWARRLSRADPEILNQRNLLERRGSRENSSKPGSRTSSRRSSDAVKVDSDPIELQTGQEASGKTEYVYI